MFTLVRAPHVSFSGAHRWQAWNPIAATAAAAKIAPRVDRRSLCSRARTRPFEKQRKCQVETDGGGAET
jgi:hypothetical protein